MQECHDNDDAHRLRDSEKIKVATSMLELGEAVLSGRFRLRPKMDDQRRCRYGAHCRNKDTSCPFNHNAICKFNWTCGGCTIESCVYAHVDRCNTLHATMEEKRQCLFDHTLGFKSGIFCDACPPSEIPHAASHRCDECNEYMCFEMSKAHRKSKFTRTHVVNVLP